MSARSLSINLAATAWLLLAGVGVHAQDAKDALTRFPGAISSHQSTVLLSGPMLAVADFDNDHKTDAALLLNTDGFRGRGKLHVEVHIAGRQQTYRVLASPGAVDFAALDIDHDGDIDLVVEQAFTHRRLQVLLNDGQGDFSEGKLTDYPSAAAPMGMQLTSLVRLDSPAVFLPSQRGLDLSILMACWIAGRPPSCKTFGPPLRTVSTTSSAFSRLRSRAPPVSRS